MLERLRSLNHPGREPDLRPEVRAELARLLFTTIVPKTIIGMSTIVCCLVLAWRTDSGALLATALAALLVTLWRITCVLGFRRFGDAEAPLAWEKSYAAGNFAFSSILALFAVLAAREAGAIGEVMAAVLIISYCAGIVARAAIRPWIAVPSVIISAGTLAIVIALEGTLEHWVTAAILVALIAGSIDTIDNSYRITLEHLTTRLRFADMAALDSLTGLPNRSMLHERLDALFAAGESRRIAIHFLDLDHFKAINDSYGHAAGDQILIEVARRLRAALSGRAFAARLGGDEFVIIQPDLADDEEASAFSRQLVETISWPIPLPNGAIAMQASDGCCIVETGAATGAEAMAAADAALYQAKRDGRGRAVVRGYVRPDEPAEEPKAVSRA